MSKQSNFIYFGYSFLNKNLLIITPNITTIIDPIRTGVNKQSNETDPIITIIGLPPAGGCVTLNNIINITEPAWTKNPKDLKEEDYKTFYKDLFPPKIEKIFH